MQIFRYSSLNADELLTAISQDPDWEIFTKDDAIDHYRESLNQSITYVCYIDNDFCGFIRAVLDPDIAVYISELFVVPQFRNKKIGHLLLERVKNDYSQLSVYVLSDEDAYYEKYNYKRIGSIFEL